MSDRQQTSNGQFKKRRGDTRIGTIEKEYGVDFGVRSDTKLATYLEENGVPSLSKALKKLNDK
ncbi:hypothetical protein K8Q94_00345 [Candidatus Nomurabacteria bacterium]|nr:hypothetical protein [Candidatus Nomurabacteria bacterium]